VLANGLNVESNVSRKGICRAFMVFCKHAYLDLKEGVKNRLNFRNACYYAFQNLLSSCLLSKNVKIKICETTVLAVVLFECET
jgi:hypothetical protein